MEALQTDLVSDLRDLAKRELGVPQKRGLERAAEAIEKLRAENRKLKEALTPSGDTKADYIAEVECETNCPACLGHYVPWSSIKQIMTMIRTRATLGNALDEASDVCGTALRKDDA